MAKLEKRDLWIDGKCKTIRIAPSIWQAFLDLAIARKIASNQLAKVAQRDHNGTLAQAIEAYVRQHSDRPVYLHANRESWLDQAIEAMRPVFASRGYPLPAKIRASVGFTSKGMRGKRIGECWSSGASADGHAEIFLDPSKNADAVALVDVLTHELCHTVDHANGRKGHTKTFKAIGAALDLEGKATCMAGGTAWRVWALPLIETLGPCPYGKLAEQMKAVKKQTTRMLKLECPDEDCGAVWRMSAAHLASEGGSPRVVRCPCCQERVANPLEEGGDEEE